MNIQKLGLLERHESRHFVNEIAHVAYIGQSFLNLSVDSLSLK